ASTQISGFTSIAFLTQRRIGSNSNLEPLHWGLNPKSWQTPRIVFPCASRSEGVRLLAFLFSSSGRLKVTLQPSSLTAFIPYRFFATICAPKSANDDFHA